MSMFDLMRIWAMVTGLALVLWFFTQTYFEMTPSGVLPMLIAAIGGFEMFLYGQDLWLKRRGRHG